MAIHTDEGETIKGAVIIGEARKISDPVVIAKSGRHKSKKVILRDNAVCRISKKLKFIK